MSLLLAGGQTEGVGWGCDVKRSLSLASEIPAAWSNCLCRVWMALDKYPFPRIRNVLVSVWDEEQLFSGAMLLLLVLQRPSPFYNTLILPPPPENFLTTFHA